ncbi:hypothetical protein Droror1_Dr00019719 [Drosera rotundifolia]
MEDKLFANVHSTVFKESETLQGKSAKIEGYDFNRGVNYQELLKSFITTGFQASNLGDAIEVVNQMTGGSNMRDLLRMQPTRRRILCIGSRLGARCSWALPRIWFLLVQGHYSVSC